MANNFNTNIIILKTNREKIMSATHKPLYGIYLNHDHIRNRFKNKSKYKHRMYISFA